MASEPGAAADAADVAMNADESLTATQGSSRGGGVAVGSAVTSASALSAAQRASTAGHSSDRRVRTAPETRLKGYDARRSLRVTRTRSSTERERTPESTSDPEAPFSVGFGAVPSTKQRDDFFGSDAALPDTTAPVRASLSQGTPDNSSIRPPTAPDPPCSTEIPLFFYEDRAGFSEQEPLRTRQLSTFEQVRGCLSRCSSLDWQRRVSLKAQVSSLTGKHLELSTVA